MPMPAQLVLPNCPRCGVKNPAVAITLGPVATKAFDGTNGRVWAPYVCSTCGGVMLACARGLDTNNVGGITEVLPPQRTVAEEIPDPARKYLTQARDSLHAPDGAVMLAASAVDAMLKAKDYRAGWLYDRIEQAAKDHVITADMAKWAHHVRLGANEPRHADNEKPHATGEEAAQAVEFAAALGHILFVLPARVKRGLKAAGVQDGETSGGA